MIRVLRWTFPGIVLIVSMLVFARPGTAATPTPIANFSTTLPVVKDVATPTPAPSTLEWSQFGHDAQHTSFTNQVVNTPWQWAWSWNGPTASGAVVAGKFALPANVQPVTGDGNVYVAAGSHGVFALNEATGAVQWNATNVGTVNSTVAYDPTTTTLFVVSTNGILYQLNPTTGSINGQFSTGQSSTLPLPPVVLGDRVVFSMGTSVYAVNNQTLAQDWTYNAGSAIQTPPAYSPSRNRIVVVTQDLFVRAVDNQTGTLVWQVKPTVRTPGDPAAGPDSLAEALNGWPVIAELHGLVLVKYRLDWNTMWTWSPWPTANATMLANLQSQPIQQALFALSLDTGAVPFVTNVGNGGFGDGGYLPMGPQPVVKAFSDGTEVAYTVIRGNTGTDGRWDSKWGEVELDSVTESGYQAGNVRFIYYDPSGLNTAWPTPYLLTDEQPWVSMAGDYLFGGHWMAGYAVQIGDRVSSLGSFTSPISTTPVPQITNSSTSCGFSASHYCPNGVTQDGDPRNYGPSGFYIYYNQPGVYNQYDSGYATWLVSNSNLYFVSIDGAVVAFVNGNPQSAVLDLANSVKAAETLISTGPLLDVRRLVASLAAFPDSLFAALPSSRVAEPSVIPYTDAALYAGQVKTIEGTIEYDFNNRQSVSLRFIPSYRGSFVARILQSDWSAFDERPDQLYHVGETIRVTGTITWYKGDPAIYVHSPNQIEVVH
jgi:hypothetical protein